MCKILILFSVIFSSFSYASDIDRDELEDDIERKIGTSVTSKDTDGDGSTDGDEVNYQTDPTNPNHKILKIGESKRTGRRYVAGSGYFSTGYHEHTGIEREIVTSFNDKIETKTINSLYDLSYHSRMAYINKLEYSYQQKRGHQDMMARFKKERDDREKVLVISPKYEEIQKMRVESNRLKKIYKLSNSFIDKNTYTEYNKSLMALTNAEYQKYKFMLTENNSGGSGNSYGSSFDELEDKVEDLEDKVSDYEEQIEDLEDTINGMD